MYHTSRRAVTGPKKRIDPSSYDHRRPHFDQSRIPRNTRSRSHPPPPSRHTWATASTESKMPSKIPIRRQSGGRMHPTVRDDNRDRNYFGARSWNAAEMNYGAGSRNAAEMNYGAGSRNAAEMNYRAGSRNAAEMNYGAGSRNAEEMNYEVGSARDGVGSRGEFATRNNERMATTSYGGRTPPGSRRDHSLDLRPNAMTGRRGRVLRSVRSPWAQPLTFQPSSRSRPLPSLSHSRHSPRSLPHAPHPRSGFTPRTRHKMSLASIRPVPWHASLKRSPPSSQRALNHSIRGVSPRGAHPLESRSRLHNPPVRPDPIAQRRGPHTPPHPPPMVHQASHAGRNPTSQRSPYHKRRNLSDVQRPPPSPRIDPRSGRHLRPAVTVQDESSREALSFKSSHCSDSPPSQSKSQRIRSFESSQVNSRMTMAASRSLLEDPREERSPHGPLDRTPNRNNPSGIRPQKKNVGVESRIVRPPAKTVPKWTNEGRKELVRCKTPASAHTPRIEEQRNAYDQGQTKQLTRCSATPQTPQREKNISTDDDDNKSRSMQPRKPGDLMTTKRGVSSVESDVLKISTLSSGETVKKEFDLRPEEIVVTRKYETAFKSKQRRSSDGSHEDERLVKIVRDTGDDTSVPTANKLPRIQGGKDVGKKRDLSALAMNNSDGSVALSLLRDRGSEESGRGRARAGKEAARLSSAILRPFVDMHGDTDDRVKNGIPTRSRNQNKVVGLEPRSRNFGDKDDRPKNFEKESFLFKNSDLNETSSSKQRRSESKDDLRSESKDEFPDEGPRERYDRKINTRDADDLRNSLARRQKQIEGETNAERSCSNARVAALEANTLRSEKIGKRRSSDASLSRERRMSSPKHRKLSEEYHSRPLPATFKKPFTFPRRNHAIPYFSSSYRGSRPLTSSSFLHQDRRAPPRKFEINRRFFSSSSISRGFGFRH